MLAGHRLSAHIPTLPNMVNEHVSKWRKLDKKFPSTPAAIKYRLAAELTSRLSETGSKYKWNSPLHCSEYLRMTKTSAIIAIKTFFSSPRKIVRAVDVPLLVILTFIRKSLWTKLKLIHWKFPFYLHLIQHQTSNFQFLQFTVRM